MKEKPTFLNRKLFFIVDKDGYDLFREKDGKKFYFGDRDYFRLQRNSVTNELLISNPHIGRVTGAPTMVFARKIVDRKGVFQGAVCISIPLTFFRDLYSKINVGKKGTITLGSNENIIYSRYPWDDKSIGQSVFTKNFSIDNVKRFYSNSRVANTKFYVVVGISRDEVLASWKQRSVLYAIGFLIFWFGGAVYTLNFLRSMQELDERKKMAVQNAKFISLGEMASGIAHEINNPLAVIQSRTLQLKRSIDRDQYDPNQFRESLLKINQTVERIAKIIRGLKTFARHADGDPLTSVQIKSIVENALELCTEKFRNHHVLLKVDPVPEVIIQGRESQLVQVLLNLLTNAFDAVENRPEKWVHVSFTMMKRDSISIVVTDSGEGIPDHVAQNIMQPFFTTKDVGKGTGLGLSISKGIIDGHKGELYLDRRSTQTRFVITLPVAQIQNESPVKDAG